MTKISEFLGLDEKIDVLVEKALENNSSDVFEFKRSVEATIESLSTDVYANMKSIEQQKYRMVELEINLSNLVDFVKSITPGGGI